MILLTYHISISQANRCRRKLAAATPAKYERDFGDSEIQFGNIWNSKGREITERGLQISI